MRNSALVVLMAAVPVACLAQATVGDLSKIQGDTLIIKAKVNRETAQAELDARIRAGGGGVPTDDVVPVVKSVYGAGNALVANFLYPNGTTLEARVGDTLNGGYKVAKIGVDKVELVKNKRSIQIGFSATPPAAAVAPAVTMPGAPMQMPQSLPGMR